ncbi:MAG: glucose-1-phosphate thymidylyltransferase [Candidatus Coatesbacteria bacterium]|nr:glucose-1-phosphate thymidylyltransferase [Candidatus Coatesbacteria bacterium]
MFSPPDLFSLTDFEHNGIFDGLKYAWEALPRIEDYIKSVIRPGIHGEIMSNVTLLGDVFIGEGTVVEPGAFINGPTIIGKNCQVRQNAYIRGSVLVGDGCVVGHSTEVKNALFMNASNAPHFNYVGDSILGAGANLGAGTKLSNFKITVDKTIKIKVGDEVFDTGLIKFGAILGDGVQTGCNAVLNPGTLVGRRSQIYANSLVRGYIPPNTIVKLRQSFDLSNLT